VLRAFAETPVVDRVSPHESQNAFSARFWMPHLVQATIGRSVRPHRPQNRANALFSKAQPQHVTATPYRIDRHPDEQLTICSRLKSDCENRPQRHVSDVQRAIISYGDPNGASQHTALTCLIHHPGRYSCRAKAANAPAIRLADPDAAIRPHREMGTPLSVGWEDGPMTDVSPIGCKMKHGAALAVDHVDLTVRGNGDIGGLAHAHRRSNLRPNCGCQRAVSREPHNSTAAGVCDQD
jgi:hypothetical protein